MFTLSTCSYSQFRPSMGTAIQTSIGRPRWPLRYSLDLKITELMPQAWMLGLPEEEYAGHYLNQLADVGAEYLTARFAAIAEATGDQRLVLLCFENLAKPGAWCHRTMLASFWKEATGGNVRELGAAADDGLF